MTMIVKIEAFIEVPKGTSLRSIENEVNLWLEQACDMQQDWFFNEGSVEEQ